MSNPELRYWLGGYGRAGHFHETDYQYIGFIGDTRDKMVAGRKGNAAHPAFKALDWTLRSETAIMTNPWRYGRYNIETDY